MAYELTSDLVSVTVADFGAHLASVLLRLEDNHEHQITVPYPTDGERREFHGASIGRYANRIAGSRFTLDGEEYQLESNEGENQLHGGPENFSDYAWSADAETKGDTGRVVLHHKSKAGDMGFPGKLHATAIFELTENKLTIDYRAKATEPTPVCLTNHAYWNLGDDGSLNDHELVLAAPRYVAVDDQKIPVAGPPLATAGTRYDCSSERSLGEVTKAGGFDHCFVLDPRADVHATLSHASGRRIDITTNQVGLQVYTGQHLAVDARGIAFEPECLPNTPNRPDFGDATVRPGDKYLSSTTYVFRA